MRIADIDGFDGGYRRRLGGFPATDGTLELWTYWYWAVMDSKALQEGREFGLRRDCEG